MENESSLPIMPEDMHIAQNVARTLDKRGVDANEAHKALEFLVKHKSGPDFFTFMQTLQRNGSVVVRSNRTLQYYAVLSEVCRQYLRRFQDDPTRMAYILGWAIRLMPFYRLEPHLPRPAHRPTSTGAATPDRPPETTPGGARLGQSSGALADLRPRQQRNGRVVRLAPFGAFVDIGVGVDGLVHVSKLRSGFVQKPEDVVKVGDQVTVWVEQVDPQRRRVSLSMIDPGPRDDQVMSEQPVDTAIPPKAITPRPAAVRVTSADQVKPGLWVKGTVTRIEPNRLVVDIGLAEAASLTFERLPGRPNDPDQVAERWPVDTVLEVQVVGVNRRNRVQLALAAN
jgi:hypothetical protein